MDSIYNGIDKNKYEEADYNKITTLYNEAKQKVNEATTYENAEYQYSYYKAKLNELIDSLPTISYETIEKNGCESAIAELGSATALCSLMAIIMIIKNKKRSKKQ